MPCASLSAFTSHHVSRGFAAELRARKTWNIPPGIQKKAELDERVRVVEGEKREIKQTGWNRGGVRKVLISASAPMAANRALQRDGWSMVAAVRWSFGAPRDAASAGEARACGCAWVQEPCAKKRTGRSLVFFWAG